MADTRITKIQVRQGNIAELPMLNTGEFGYATDVNRLFIGNSIYTVGTGNGAQVVFPIPNGNVLNPSFYIDDVQANGTTYTVAGNLVTFSTPPATGELITMRYNTEVTLSGDNMTPNSAELAASAAAGTTTNFGFDTAVYNTAFIDYSVRLSGGTGFRIGQLRIVIDNVAETYYIDDQFNYLTQDADITFDGDITNGVFSLTYENNETSTATLYYTYKLWKM